MQNKTASAKRGHDDTNSVSSDEDFADSGPEECSTSKASKKYDGSAKYKVKFNPFWSQNYPVKAVSNDRFSFHCIPCARAISCGHQGLKDVKVHCERVTHKKRVDAAKKTQSIAQLIATGTDFTSKNVIKAEVMVTNSLVQHNLPIATADHLGPLFKEVFPDRKIAASYASGRTKSSAIINNAIGPQCHTYLVQHCKNHPFSLGIEGGSHTGLEKMNPVTIRIFDINRSKQVESHFYDMCTTSGEDCGKPAAIFDVLVEKFQNDSIPWHNAVSLSVDDTNAMIGCNNSIASRRKNENPDIFISGCACHLAHIAATEANDAFTDVLGINIEDVLIDLFYWFDKSSKRKGKLSEYFEFCDQDYQKVLKHVSTRWLSLERCVERALKKFPSLKAYFLSESFPDQRFGRLEVAFSNPILESVLLFHQASMQLFTELNKLLQRSEPTIRVLRGAMLRLVKKVASRIVQPQFIKDAELEQLDLSNDTMFKPNKSIFLGGVTKPTLTRLLNEGDITETLFRKFYAAAHSYFKSSLSYILKKFPLKDELIRNAVWIDVSQLIMVEWKCVQYFYDRYSTMFEEVPVDILYEEFCEARKAAYLNVLILMETRCSIIVQMFYCGSLDKCSNRELQ